MMNDDDDDDAAVVCCSRCGLFVRYVMFAEFQNLCAVFGPDLLAFVIDIANHDFSRHRSFHLSFVTDSTCVMMRFYDSSKHPLICQSSKSTSPKIDELKALAKVNTRRFCVCEILC